MRRLVSTNGLFISDEKGVHLEYEVKIAEEKKAIQGVLEIAEKEHEIIVPGRLCAVKSMEPTLWGDITPDGVIVLSKSCPGYNVLASTLKRLCTQNTLTLMIKARILAKRAYSGYPQEMLKVAIDLELMRRKIKKRGGTNG